MHTFQRRPLLVPLTIFIALLIIMLGVLASATPVSASQQEPVCFNLDPGLGVQPGPWSSSGVVTSSGQMTFLSHHVAGYDPQLGIIGTVHGEPVLTDQNGTITFRMQGSADLVPNDEGDVVPGYRVNWVITGATGAYSGLHGQGDGASWPDWNSWTFPVRMCGQAHFEP